MKRESFNNDWVFIPNASSSVQDLAHKKTAEGKPICLPHDAMIHEVRTPDAPSRSQSGFYPGGIYAYVKKIYVPEEEKNQRTLLEFEGVYKNASVFINGAYAGGYHNGYTEFVVDTDGFLRYGAENEIKVTVNNAAQPSSRWYTGSGIYRNVNLLRAGRVHLSQEGVHVRTITADDAMAALTAKFEIMNEEAFARDIKVIVEVLAADGTLAARDELPMTIYGNCTEALTRHLQVSNPHPWDCDTPTLYQYRVRITENNMELDREDGCFGIRTLLMDASRGLLLNGKAIKLRGACIHHDNGILGACAFEKAEARRCRQLKGAGFNCIRSAHNPISRAMLDACDRQGMLVIDEYADMWTVSKNPHDDAQHFSTDWKRDLASLVRKDYNHPSVIMYCLGNEIPEAGTPRGAALSREMDTYIKTLDDSRFTVNSISGILSAASRMGEIFADLMKDRKPEAPKQSGEGKGQDGISAMNNMMSMLNGPLGDAMMKHPIMTEILEPYATSTDITGLNYMPSRYALEKEMHPNRLVLGTECYPGDIARLWGLVKQYPHVIGDCTWTGYDYIGEAGIGIFYYDGTVNFTPHWPDSLAYIGDIDIIGYRRPISYFREVVYGLRKTPYIAVKRMNRNGMEHSLSPWMFKDNIASWTWPGYEGKMASVDIYTDAESVQLYLNGNLLGMRPAGEANDFTATFEVPYAPGSLVARAIRDGQPAEECGLDTTGSAVRIVAIPEGDTLKADGSDILYIPICLVDEMGNENLHAQKDITISVEGPAAIAAFGSADPQTENTYGSHSWSTYDGHLLAVIRAGMEAGLAKIRFTADGCKTATIQIQVG